MLPTGQNYRDALWLGALFFLSALAWAQEPIGQYREPNSINSLQGSASLAEPYRVVIDAPKAIRSLLKKHLDIVRFAARSDMTSGQFDFLVVAATSQIAALLKAQGYFTPEIQVRVERSVQTRLDGWVIPSAEGIKIVSIRVGPGEPIKIKAVELAFKGALLAEHPWRTPEEAEKLALSRKAKAHGADQQDREVAVRKIWPLREGDVFTQSAWDDAKAMALKTLQAERFLGAKITASQALIDPKKHRAYLEVTFDSGPPFILGPVEFADLQRYPERIIHHVNPLHVGEPYSSERLLELQRRIQNTPYFASVIVDVSAENGQRLSDIQLKPALTSDMSSPNQVMRSIEILSPSSSSTKPGAATRDDTSTRIAPVKVKVSEYPYHSLRFGIGYNSDIGPHVQGQYGYNNMFGRAWVLETQGQWDPKQQSTGFQLSTPPDERAYTYSVLAHYKRSDIENTDIRSVTTGVQRVRLQSRYEYTYSLLFYGDRLIQDSAPSSWSRALVPGWSWLRRDVDDLLFPREGSLLFFAANAAAKGVLTEQSFGRVHFSGRQYVPLGRRGIGVFRMEWGGVFTSGHSAGIPASLLFRAGGSNSIRGYSNQSIGNEVAGSVLPVKYVATGSAEYQYWFNHDWGVAAFYDAGTAADTWAERIFYQGVGLGARWRSPVGPINVDVAYGLRNHAIHPYITLGIAF